MPNRLASSQSLYLQKHANNPIDWWPWCEEALAQAKQENKPIFLSIGYSSCHWCTVMEGEAFSDPAIADYLNANFLPIKVDREERPDIDSIYMQALQMMITQGGWPLNIWLDPYDLVPFYGGTYFPVEPRYGRPGFLQLLQALRDHYDQQPEQVAQIKGQILAALQPTVDLAAGANLFDRTLVEQGWQENAAVLAEGRSSNRFPMIPYADFVLRGYRVTSPELGATKFQKPCAPVCNGGWPWPWAASTTMWAAAFIATPLIPPGQCPILKKCSTTMGKSWSFWRICGVRGPRIPPCDRAFSGRSTGSAVK